ncbi:FKBP-type peptidyl-prolyl cis-trans isomerase [Nitzschia inconspicua]|uniref:peptidylprolyl isomerase n=1 Tax=Nitzschia inconspicua TaxID=303405 RepID=A0A9K3Q5A7_9STRA|nr:FKBP-type peptidyl-prolyl cis-trans isomerase [Nitzschia inconspicua]
MSVNPLEEVNTSKENDDPFDRYEQSQQQTTVAIKDRVEGTGMLVEGDGQLLTVAYKGRFMESGKQFDQSDNFVCRIGRNSVLPGFEDGLRGMRVGGLRTIRIPPNKAYGDEWYKGTIPPSSHLEFDLELKNIAQTPQEEFQVQLEKFGVGRAIGGAIIIAYLAVTNTLLLVPLQFLPFLLLLFTTTRQL